MNEGIRQAVDDLYTSTRSSSPPPVVAQPRGDVSMSTSSTSDENRAPIDRPAPNHAEQNNDVASPRGDISMSSASDENRAPIEPMSISGPESSQAAQVARPSNHRPVTKLHLSMVTSYVSKSLIEDLQNAAQFTSFDRGRVRSIDRSTACAEILSIWQLKGEETKTVDDLKVLLETAGGPQKKYKQLVKDIDESPLS